MENIGGWEIINLLGEGGQSQVFLVRSPERQKERQANLKRMVASLPVSHMGEPDRATLEAQFAPGFAEAIAQYARPDLPSELGALKKFNIRGSEEQALKRLKNEIEVLKQNRPGLLKLLGSNEAEQWIVTEYRPEGTIEKSPLSYKGKAAQALRAFRSLVETVASLHEDKIVHRDIKPANVFFGKDDTLVLGDFGIVFLPDLSERFTVTNERVGPRDYMPQWGDLGGRLENVHANFDVYMLGKLLWCMVSGRLKLPREYHKRRGFNLTEMFPNDPAMKMINDILDQCLVEEPEECFASAHKLLTVVDEAIAVIELPVPMLDPQTGVMQLPCRMCGKGFYQPRQETLDLPNSLTNRTLLRMFVCNVCTHFEFFAPLNPEEAARRMWKPWKTD